MADLRAKEIQSYNMSRIKSTNTKPELIVRRFLFSNKFKFRLHVKNRPGKPDIVLPKYNIVIFVHGCFWHGHNECKYFVIQKQELIGGLIKLILINKEIYNAKEIVKF
jgi:DNA mismatch endonuclease (patch repair protein)